MSTRGFTAFTHPFTNQILVWGDVATWWCFDCLQEADDYYYRDGFVRCFDCTAVWGEHHLDDDMDWPRACSARCAGSGVR